MEFRVGDEVVCVFAGPWWCTDTAGPTSGPDKDTVWTVESLDFSEDYGTTISLNGWPGDSFVAECFRKVERRNDSLSIEAFLTIKSGFEEPRKTPAKKREKVT